MKLSWLSSTRIGTEQCNDAPMNEKAGQCINIIFFYFVAFGCAERYPIKLIK